LKNRHVLATITGWLVFVSSALAQTPDPVDPYILSECKSARIPGLALLVIRDGKIVKAQGYGFSNLELQVPVKLETIFQSGSVGKQFTATAVMMLVEEGKLSLDDPLTKFFPNAPAAWKDVKVRHLLSHTGGFTDYPEDFDFRRDYTEDELLKNRRKHPARLPARIKVGATATSATSRSAFSFTASPANSTAIFLDNRIFQPLGMNTRVISEADIIPNRAAGYRLVKGQLKNQEWVAPRAEHHRRRQPLLHDPRPSQMGCRPLH